MKDEVQKSGRTLFRVHRSAFIVPRSSFDLAMRLTPMQQLMILRDGLTKIRTFGSGPLTVQDVHDEAEELLKLPLVQSASYLEPELKKLKHWKELWRERKGL